MTEGMAPLSPDDLEWTDSERLRLLARWFDMWDRPEVDRQAILDDVRFPGKNDVQLDLLRIAFSIEEDREEIERLKRELQRCEEGPWA